LNQDYTSILRTERYQLTENTARKNVSINSSCKEGRREEGRERKEEGMKEGRKALLYTLT